MKSIKKSTIAVDGRFTVVVNFFSRVAETKVSFNSIFCRANFPEVSMCEDKPLTNKNSRKQHQIDYIFCIYIPYIYHFTHQRVNNFIYT